MRKFHRTKSEFWNPILQCSNDFFFVRPYAYAKAFNKESSEIRKMCEEGKLPCIPDGYTYLILIDNRKSGEGGKFTCSRSPENGPIFPFWKGGEL